MVLLRRPLAAAARPAAVALTALLALALPLAVMAGAPAHAAFPDKPIRIAIVGGARLRPGCSSQDGRPMPCPTWQRPRGALPDLPRLAAERARAEEALGRAGATGALAASLAGAPFGDDPRLDLRLWQTVAARAAATRPPPAAAAEAARLWEADQRLTVARTPEEKAWQERLRAGAAEGLGRRAEAAFEGVPLAEWAPAFADAAPASARAPLLRLQEAGRVFQHLPLPEGPRRGRAVGARLARRGRVRLPRRPQKRGRGAFPPRLGPRAVLARGSIQPRRRARSLNVSGRRARRLV